jgi:glycosyltransferase involved in cell wall biosynthesis
MKLVIVIDSLVCGGAERVAVNLANHWATQGRQITVVTLAHQDLDFYRLDPAVQRVALGLETNHRKSIFTVLKRSLQRAWTIRHLLRRVEPDIAIAFMTVSNVLLAGAAIGCKRLVTIGTEHIYPPRQPLPFPWNWVRQVLYGRLSAVTAVTSEIAAWLKSSTHAQRVETIPNPATWPIPRQQPVVSPQALLPASCRVVLAVGRLVDQKQFNHLITAFAHIAQDHPGWFLVILGEGQEREALQAQIKQAGMTGRVFLPGQVGNMADWYQRADLYVMSSKYEGFPNTLVEALCYGLPAVSYDCETGPRDIIRHGHDGLLVPAGDMVALSASLGRLIRDDGQRQFLAANAVQARERFSLLSVAQSWEVLFTELRTAQGAAQEQQPE